MGKLGKAIAVSFDDPETCQGPRWDVPLDDRLVLDAVACHYYRTGRADLADAAAAARFGAGAEAAAARSSATAASAAQRLAARAGALERDETRRVVLDGIRKRDVRPLLDWIGKNAVAIETAEAAGRLSPFFGDALPFAPFREPVRGRVSLQLELFAHRAAIGAALERGEPGEAARRARESLELASRVNDYRARIRAATKSLMATVSELSMYQASAASLEEERDRLVDDLAMARERAASGEAPDEDAEREWARQVRSEETASAAARDREDAAAVVIVLLFVCGLVQSTRVRCAQGAPKARR